MKLGKYATNSKYRILQKLEGGTVKTQTQIAEDLEKSQQSISRTINDLKETECVEDKGMREGYKITTKGAELLHHLDQINNSQGVETKK